MNESTESWLAVVPAIMAWVCLIAGCARGGNELTPAGDHVDLAPADPGGSIELIEVDRAAYDRIIAQHEGSVVLVDYWATWCLPCLQQFPHTIELADNFADRGLVVVSVSLDDPADSDRVVEFLRSHRANRLTHLISQFGGGPRSVDAFDIPGGAVPHYKIYDRSGKLVTTFALDPSAERQFTADDIDAALDKLLDRKD